MSGESPIRDPYECDSANHWFGSDLGLDPPSVTYCRPTLRTAVRHPRGIGNRAPGPTLMAPERPSIHAAPTQIAMSSCSLRCLNFVFFVVKNIACEVGTRIWHRNNNHANQRQLRNAMALRLCVSALNCVGSVSPCLCGSCPEGADFRLPIRSAITRSRR